MPSHGRRRRDSWSDDDAASTSGRVHPSTAADSHNQQGESHQTPAPSLTSWKSGSGGAVAVVHAHSSSHDDSVRAKASALQGGTIEQSGSNRVTPETSMSTASRCYLPTSSVNDDVAAAVEEAEEVPTKDCYIPPSQDNGEDDKDTFVDKGSAAALDVVPNVTPGFNAGHAVAFPIPGAAAMTGAVAAVPPSKRTGKVRPAVSAHGPPTLNVAVGGPSSSSSLASISARPGNSISVLGPLSGCGATSLNLAATASSINVSAVTGSGATRDNSNNASAINVSAITGAAGGGGGGCTPGQAARPCAATSVSLGLHTNTPLARQNNTGKPGASNLANAPQYSRLSSSEAAPGVVYRASLAVRAMAMDPEQPVLWAAVGDDPLATLRIEGGELCHSKSVKDIEQVHCMAVVRIAKDHGTTFKSAPLSSRSRLSMPKLDPPKTGRRSKKNGRRSAATRKSGKLDAATGSSLPMRSADGADNDDENGSNGDEDAAAGTSGARDKPIFSTNLWCGLSRGHMAVVNMATLEYQIIHNAHTQTVNRVWYWEARNKVWTAGREKGVHVWDPQRRVILKKRNIAAILTDATYADAADRVFAVAGDSCVRVFEPGGENVNVPKGQENRIKMKSDASVIQYHRNSGLVWVGLARGSVLMNPVSMDTERTLPFTFSAILFEGEHAIIAGQEGQNGESRLMVLDVSNPRDPSVLAYTKFPNPLPLGIHVIPHTRFAVAAQEDTKKGVVAVIFVYTGTVALTHTVTTASKYPDQRTEKVIRGPAAGAALSSPAQVTQQPLTVSTQLNFDTAGPINAPAAGSCPPTTDINTLSSHVGGGSHNNNNNVATNINNNSSNAVVMVDRAALHRAAVVKCAPESRTDRKFNVEADHSTLVEAIGPEAQEIKSALKHLVKTADEVRQSLVQQRSSEATLADFSRLLRGRQQWLMEQGPITSLPVLTPAVTERINRDYVTPEGKTVATAIEHLQHMYANAQAKLQQHQQLQSLNSAHLSATNPMAPTRLSSSPSSPPGLGYTSSGVAETSGQNRVGGSDERHVPSFREGDTNNNNSNSTTANNTVPGSQRDPPATGIGANDAVLPPWASQLAASLQRERVLHEQQLNALQLQMERLAERNAALSNAFVRLQTHVATLGQQSLSSLDVGAPDSTAVTDSEDLNSATLRHMLPNPFSQQGAVAAIFHQLSRSKHHKPKYVRQTAEVLVRAIDELMRMTEAKASRTRGPDALGNAAKDDWSGSVAARPSHIRAPRYQASSSPLPSPPLANDLQHKSPQQQALHVSAAAAAINAGEAVKTASHPQSCPAGADEGKSTRMDRPIISFRSAYSMAEAEVSKLHEINAEVTSFWARLQNTHPQGITTTTTTTSAVAAAAVAAAVQDDEATERGVKSVDGGLLLSLSPRNVGASPTLLHLMAARVLQAVCWAECGQTVLRELTNSSGLENPFVAGCVHNAPVPARIINACLNGAGANDSQQEWWRQGPLEVLDYESTQERAEVLLKVNQLSTSSGIELSNSMRIREALQARFRASKECHTLHKDSEFMMHRLPGALYWSQTALRLLFNFLESTENVLTAARGARGEGPARPKEERTRLSTKTHTSTNAALPQRHDVTTRAASAVGVAMTHWALFLLNLRADLLGVHHATRLYHAWCWGSASTSTAQGVRSCRATPRRSQRGGGAEVLVEDSVPNTSLADIAASLTSKGKLLLLYMQWCFPAFGGAAGVNGAGGAGAVPTAPSCGAPTGVSATVSVPSFFCADLENDAASTASVHRSAAECAAMLADIVAHTSQLLRRVTLLLSYCHIIRTRSLAALEGSGDASVARLVEFMGPTASADIDARVPTEQEKAFLRSEAHYVLRP
ncbi:hypothetical protein ABL78_2235 [Leptomonas seymouri]|uniref:Uncharacterized protein n=1 Tax=Leptomonas seymouri TaxID=5684 RepID=A0A0N1I7S6_LEPSE|nr:hypothetical protein ABL78_2235 [Leptomonas seymouri]|eukprot:KPI88631.1 hypothetical protein ABL78_2235 [Leptomonas seymouri]